MLNNLASSFVLEAHRNPRGLGSLDENALLNNKYNFPELTGLSNKEQDVLLNATIVLFIEHNICFREILGSTTFIIFPELINLKKPTLIDEISKEDDVSYTVSGAVENVYAALVVLLGYTPLFIRNDQWKNQAEFLGQCKFDTGQVCGFRQIPKGSGEIDLVLYYGKDVPLYTRTSISGLV